MSDKVIGLDRKPVNRDYGSTDPKMIEFIEDLLRRAKEGHIIGLVGGYMQENGEPRKFTTTFVFCDEGTHNAMLGVTHVAAYRLVKQLDD